MHFSRLSNRVNGVLGGSGVLGGWRSEPPLGAGCWGFPQHSHPFTPLSNGSGEGLWPSTTGKPYTILDRGTDKVES